MNFLILKFSFQLLELQKSFHFCRLDEGQWKSGKARERKFNKLFLFY
jgi:hypothetical protein